MLQGGGRFYVFVGTTEILISNISEQGSKRTDIPKQALPIELILDAKYQYFSIKLNCVLMCLGAAMTQKYTYRSERKPASAKTSVFVVSVLFEGELPYFPDCKSLPEFYGWCNFRTSHK